MTPLFLTARTVKLAAGTRHGQRANPGREHPGCLVNFVGLLNGNNGASSAARTSFRTGAPAHLVSREHSVRPSHRTSARGIFAVIASLRSQCVTPVAAI